MSDDVVGDETRVLSDDGAVVLVTALTAALTAVLALVSGAPTVAVGSAVLVGAVALVLGARDLLATPPEPHAHMLIAALAVPGVVTALFATMWFTAALLGLLGLVHAGRGMRYRVEASTING